MKHFIVIVMALVSIVGLIALRMILPVVQADNKAATCQCACPKPTPPAKPNIAPKNGLHLHTWYRPKQDLRWDRIRSVWTTPLNGMFNLDGGVPMFVVARYGNVAVCHGAVHGEILVPDGDSAKWFILDRAGQAPADEK